MKLLSIEHRLVRATLEGFAPTTTEGGLVPLEGEVDYVSAFLTVANASTDRARIGIRAALWVVALAPMWMGVAFATMAGLSQAKRAEVLDRMLNSSSFLPRELALLIKISAAFALMSTRSIRARSGYDRRGGKPAPHVEPVLARPAAKKPRALPVLFPDRASNPGVA